jgi:hypothetical protein
MVEPHLGHGVIASIQPLPGIWDIGEDDLLLLAMGLLIDSTDCCSNAALCLSDSNKASISAAA